MTLKNVQIMGLAGLLLISCGGSPNDANDANFTKALNAYYEAHPDCIRMPQTKNDKGYDYVAVIADDSKPLGKSNNENKLTPYIELSNVGILVAEKTTIEEKFFSQVREVPAMGFKLTDKAKSFLYEPTRNEKFFGDSTHICYGHREVVEIDNFTEPADAFGAKLSKVNYSYKIVNVADWFSNLDDDGRFAKTKLAANAIRKADDELVLSANGWVHHKQFNR